MAIPSCSIDQLNQHIADGHWRLDQDLHHALQNRALELDTEGVGLGTDEFWFETQDYLTPEQLANLTDDDFMNEEAMCIDSCTINQLNQLIADGGWTLDQDLHHALQNRAMQLDTEGVGLGTDAFWFETQDYLTPEQLASLTDDNFMNQEGAGSTKQFDINKHVEISEDYRQHVKRFKTTGTSRSVQFKNLDQVVDVHSFAMHAVEKLADVCLADAQPHDHVGLAINHPGLHKPIYVPFGRRDKLNAETIAQKIEDVLNSNDEFQLDDRMQWNFVRVENTAGSGPPAGTSEDLDVLVDILRDTETDQHIRDGDQDGVAAWVQQLNDHEEEESDEQNRYRRHKFRGNMNEWLAQKIDGRTSSIIKIENTDELCLARAIMTAKAHAENKRANGPNSNASDFEKAKARRDWENIRKGDRRRYTQQRKQAQQLMKDAGLENHQGPCGITELQQLHKQLPGTRITVISSEIMFACSYDKGTGLEINLLHHDNHFNVLVSLPAFFERNFYCGVCKKAYTRKRSHVGCGHRCSCCFEVQQCEFTQWIHCTDCRRWFGSQECFNRHKVEKAYTVKKNNKWLRLLYSTCQAVQKCDKCGKNLHKSRDTKHECGKRKCQVCHENVVVSEHLCHVQPITKPPRPLVAKKKPSFIYYDTETTQDTIIGQDKNGEIRKHIVNCVCYKKVCDGCYHDDSGNQCKQCKQPRIGQWLGADSLDKFCEWLFTPENEGCYVLAHNARGFDGQFILNWMQRKGFPPDILMRGLEIISMECSRIKFLDSLNFLPVALSALPKTMGFDAAKGTFPHLFNKMSNFDYRGPLPPKEDYGTKSMKPKQLAEFNKWYDAEKASGKEFVFKEALLEYCHMDVDILTEGCMRMRQIVMEEADVDPFVCSLTMASLFMYIFRKKFLKPNTIAIVPHGGYRKKEKHSLIALKWLRLLSQRHNLNIQHARNGGEAKILNYKVDGLLRGTKEVFEFYGCIYHGCPECFPNPNQELPMSTITSGEAFQRTMTRQAELEAAGYKVHFIWECKFRKQLKDNPDQAAEVAQMAVAEPMDPREAFYGGRTNVRHMHYKAKPEETINYGDVCSLYPFICKYGKFPIGHPEIITENFEPIENRSYEGIIKAQVLVPRSLLHPVLPYRSKGKLLFPVCRTCADTRSDTECTHDDQERMIEGAWPSCELYKAMDMGCRVVRLIEVYHYTQWEQYDKVDDQTGLFTEFINTSLKQKQEASGWPAWVKTEEDKDKYISDYEEHEHIKLDRANIERNEGLRLMGKLKMNSFWGKWGQRSGLMTTKYFTSPDMYFDVVFDPTNEVHGIQIINNNLMCVVYRKVEEFIEDAPNTNVILAAWVTAQARLELYKYLERLGDRIMYMDTDSVIYVTRPGDTYEPPVGDYLGDLTDELDGGHITEFVSLGPKQYSYKKQSPTGQISTECKIRGFTLNVANINKLNFEFMKRTVQRYLIDRTQEPITLTNDCLRRTKDHEIVTKVILKTYRVVYDKCRVLPSGQTVPFGYDV